jgi:hypothetical protein
MMISLDVDRVVVLEQKGQTDRIYIKLNCSTPYPEWDGDPITPTLQMDTAQHYGKEYCEQVLGITVDEVISVR